MIDWEKYEDEMTIDQWLAKWYDLNVTIFGEAEADKYWEEDRPKNNALRKLWKVKGFTKYGQFREWEKDHMEEKRAFLERELNAED